MRTRTPGGSPESPVWWPWRWLWGVAIANSGGGTLEGPTWTLSSIADPDGGLGEPLPDVPVTAQFANDEVTGSAGCNNYFGGYQTDGDAP